MWRQWLPFNVFQRPFKPLTHRTLVVHAVATQFIFIREELEGMDVALRPVRQCVRPGRLIEGSVPAFMAFPVLG